MQEKLKQRLKELRSEFESGQKALTELENKKQNLNDTLLRISGAIQVLEEELAKDSQDESGNENLSDETVVAMHSGGKEKK